MDFLFIYGLYGALVHYWNLDGDNLDHCDLPIGVVHRFSKRAKERDPLLPAELDAVFEFLEEGSPVPRTKALQCLRYNLSREELFSDEVVVHVRGLLASVELHGSATGAP